LLYAISVKESYSKHIKENKSYLLAVATDIPNAIFNLQALGQLQEGHEIREMVGTKPYK